jgi:hypothetical protein
VCLSRQHETVYPTGIWPGRAETIASHEIWNRSLGKDASPQRYGISGRSRSWLGS